LELSTLKNQSLFALRAGVQPFPSPSPDAPLLQSSFAQDKSSRSGFFGLRLPFGAQLLCALLLVLTSFGICSCHSNAYYEYKFPADTYAGRPIPPSKLAERVMIGVSANGSSGSLQIVDALRDIRNNVADTIPSWYISGYSSGSPSAILNFPSETTGYVFSATDGSLNHINYSTEAAMGSIGSFQSASGAIAVPPNAGHYYGADEASGMLEIADNLTGSSYAINLPNVFKVMVNKGDTVALAMVRNSNVLYRVFKLNQSQYTSSALAIQATGASDCEPATLPVYCVVQVPGTYDQPTNVYFSLDGTTAYVLNCGPECGGTKASVTLLQQGPLNQNVIPSSPIQPTPQIANVAVPGGVTEALSDGTTLYLAGQQLQLDGYFEGFLSIMNQAAAVTSPTTAITGKYPISDGNHTKMLFADNDTLWIGSQFCATGEHAHLNMNYNCLTMVSLSGTTISPQIVPNVTLGSSTAVVPYPNQNDNQYYYGSLTGICWVQNYNKVYTAYGGQVHVFSTVDGSEIDNSLVTVQGTALDVAYMDALTDDAD
jgi:hypothetical protein